MAKQCKPQEPQAIKTPAQTSEKNGPRGFMTFIRQALADSSLKKLVRDVESSDAPPSYRRSSDGKMLFAMKGLCIAFRDKTQKSSPAAPHVSLISSNKIASLTDITNVPTSNDGTTHNGTGSSKAFDNDIENIQATERTKADSELGQSNPSDQPPAVFTVKARDLLQTTLIGFAVPEQQYSLGSAIRLTTLRVIISGLPSNGVATSEVSRPQLAGPLRGTWEYCSDYECPSTWRLLLYVQDAIIFKIGKLQQFGSGADFSSADFSDTLLALFNDLVWTKQLLGKQAYATYLKTWKVMDELLQTKQQSVENARLSKERGEEITRLRLEYEATAASLQELQEAWEDVPQRHMATVQNVVQQLEEKHAAEVAEVHQYYNNGIDNLQQQHNYDIAALNERIQEVTMERDEADDDCEEYVQEVDKLKDEVHTLKARESDYQRKLRVVEAENIRLQEKERQACTEINIRDDLIDKLEERSSQADSRLANTNIQLTNARSRLGEKTRNANSWKQEVQDREKKLRRSEEIGQYYQRKCAGDKDLEWPAEVSQTSKVSKKKIENALEGSLDLRSGAVVMLARKVMAENTATEAQNLPQTKPPAAKEFAPKIKIPNKHWDIGMNKTLDEMQMWSERVSEQASRDLEAAEETISSLKKRCVHHVADLAKPMTEQNSPRLGLRCTGSAGDRTEANCREQELDNDISGDERPSSSSNIQSLNNSQRLPTLPSSSSNVESGTALHNSHGNTPLNSSSQAEAVSTPNLSLERVRRHTPLTATTSPAMPATNTSLTCLAHRISIIPRLCISDSPPGSPPPPYSANTLPTGPPSYTLAVGMNPRPLLQQPILDLITGDEGDDDETAEALAQIEALTPTPVRNTSRSSIPRISPDADSPSGPRRPAKTTVCKFSYDSHRDTHSRSSMAISTSLSPPDRNHHNPNELVSYERNHRQNHKHEINLGRICKDVLTTLLFFLLSLLLVYPVPLLVAFILTYQRL